MRAWQLIFGGALIIALTSACDADDGGDGDGDADGDSDSDGDVSECGDGILEGVEVCDDGNAVDGDGCRADCLGLEVCGDGLLDVGEHCDDGALDDDGECATDCTPATLFHGYDAEVRDFMDRWDVPGGAVAVTQGGRLVLVRAYGMADIDGGEPVEHESLFRLASVSKPITAVAVLSLLEHGLIDLDAPAFSYLDDLPVIDGGVEDERLPDITVRHLLTHSGGWDASITQDPMFRNHEVAEAFGVPGPVEADLIVRWARGLPLDFDPGERYAYANFGYCLLGRIIESVTGEGYEAWVQGNVLAPVGVTSMQIGHTRLEDRVDGEVRYYGPAGVPSVYPDDGLVEAAYGFFYNESLDAHGGWIANAIDLSRFLLAVDGHDAVADLLAPETTALMTARPDVSTWAGNDAWYALGWLVRPVGDDANWWHGGSLPGTATLVTRAAGEFTWVALFNTRDDRHIDDYHADLDQTMWDAHGSVDEWPDYDLMSRYD